VIGYAPTRLPDDATEDRSLAPAARLGAGVLLVASAVIASLGAVIQPVTEPDLWWHLRVGRWILDNWRLPPHDLFTFTVPNHAWVDHEYLTEVLMWLVGSHFGLAGLSVAFGLLTWIGLLLMLLTCRPGHQPYLIVGLAVALAAVAGIPNWGPRPQILTFVLASLELLWLRRFLEGSSRAVYWLPLVMILWSNLHGGWPVAFVFLGVALVSELLHWFRNRGRVEHLERARVLTVLAAVCAVAVLINPNGPSVYAYPLETLASPAQQNLIAEWQSPNFHMSVLRAFELMLVLVIAGLAVGRPTVFETLLVLAVAVMALESARHVALFVVAATPVLIATWSRAWYRVAGDAGRAQDFVAPRGSPSRRWLSAVTLCVLALVTAVTFERIAVHLQPQPELTNRLVPVGAARWLDDHPQVGSRMFNQYSWGGYLANRFYPNPNRRVFIFSEGVLMGDDLILRYERVTQLSPDWLRVLDADGIDYVVFDAGSPLDQAIALQPRWHLAYRDDTAVIYVR
jgi:hypothetical protein